eukprot:gene43011-57203_t
MRLRQCVFVCKDLESSAEELCDILGIEVAYRDPGVAKWGLANVVCPTGHDFLEIVAPFKDGTSAGRYIERRKGDGGYMVILQVPDAAAERQRVTALGVRAVAEKDAGKFRARFAGLTEAEAKDACRALKSRKQPCVQPIPRCIELRRQACRSALVWMNGAHQAGICLLNFLTGGGCSNPQN